MAEQPVIDKPMLSKMISLLDWLYHLGVEDASYIHYDDGVVRAFMEKTGEIGNYCFLAEELEMMDWQEWILRVMIKARRTQWNKPMSVFFDLVRKKPNQTFLGAFIPMALHFYRRGVKDYVKSPDTCDMAIFHDTHRALWTTRGIRRMYPRDYVDEMQGVAFDLKRRDAKIWASKTAAEARRLGAFTERQYDMFIRAVGILRDRF